MEMKKAEIIHSKFEDIEQEEINKGYYRRTVTGENHMVCMVDMRPGWVTKRHNHANDETLLILEGSMTFTAGENVFELLPGDIIYIPPSIEHTGTAGDKGMKMIKIFSPPREDYLAGTDTYLREGQSSVSESESV